MPHQNRVTPEGDIIATPARGTMFGIRGGCFHDAHGRLARRHWASRRWICCLLEFKGRRRPLLQPGRYTELFFLDEATAFAAGHRPCFECRRADATRFAELWASLANKPARMSAPDMDLLLHAARLTREAAKRTWRSPLGALPDGVMVRIAGVAHLLSGGDLLAWTPAGYTGRLTAEAARVADVLTPEPTAAIISAGYAPMLHATARR